MSRALANLSTEGPRRCRECGWPIETGTLCTICTAVERDRADPATVAVLRTGADGSEPRRGRRVRSVHRGIPRVSNTGRSGNDGWAGKPAVVRRGPPAAPEVDPEPDPGDPDRTAADADPPKAAIAVGPPPPATTPPPAPRPVGSVRPAAPRSAPSRTGRWRNFPLVRFGKRYLPPVRLVWIFLLVLVWNADGFASRSVAWPLLALPFVSAITDLGLQFTRFPRLRIPDAAIANGLFLSVILWPTVVSVELLAVAVATVGLRHLLRRAGHPLLNPAALGVTLAATVFALPQPWHVGVALPDSALVAVLGLLLWSRARHTWRLWAGFFLANAAAALLLADYLSGPSVLPYLLETALIAPAPVFYGFFMVTEPRTAPSARRAMLVYAALVGVVAAVLPVAFTEYPALSALGVLTPYLALFLGNLCAAFVPSARGARRRPSARPRTEAVRSLPRPIPAAEGTRALPAVEGN